MNTVVYLCRHSEVHNPKKIWYGRLPGFPISEHGRELAHVLGLALADAPIAAVYSSPLERAVETAQILASYHNNLPVATDPRLMDNLTPTQGITWDEMTALGWKFFTPELIAKGGETLAMIVDRMRTSIDEKIERHKGQHIIVISHADPIIAVEAFYRGEPYTEESLHDYWIDGALEVATGFRLEFSPSGTLLHSQRVPSDKLVQSTSNPVVSASE